MERDEAGTQEGRFCCQITPQNVLPIYLRSLGQPCPRMQWTFMALASIFFTAGVPDYMEPTSHQRTAWIKKETGRINPNSAPHRDRHTAWVSAQAESFHVPTELPSQASPWLRARRERSADDQRLEHKQAEPRPDLSGTNPRFLKCFIGKWAIAALHRKKKNPVKSTLKNLQGRDKRKEEGKSNQKEH